MSTSSAKRDGSGSSKGDESMKADGMSTKSDGVTDMEIDDGPPPPPMWRNTPRLQSASTPSPGTVALAQWASTEEFERKAGTLQRHWRGLRGRTKAMHRLTWVASATLESLEEKTMQDLCAFMASLSEKGMLPHAMCEASTSQPRSLQPTAFPLNEAAVLDLIACFCREQLPSAAFVTELLNRQVMLLSDLPNICRYEVPRGCAICVVGDIHGQFGDLMHIFRCHGFPSKTRPYLFNGDFVDRGDCGVEVTLTLFAFQQLCPQSVFLNRGNHEERSTHALYGFQRECTRKYDDGIYDLFNDAFEQLPLGAVLNGKVLVLHGGIDDEMSVADLEGAPRTKYVVNAASSGGGGGGAAAAHSPGDAGEAA